MVLFSTAISKLNRLLAPQILKHGLTGRFALAGGKIRDSPMLDMLMLLPFAQTLLSIEIQDMADEERRRLLLEKEKRESSFDKFVDRMWDKYIEPHGSQLGSHNGSKKTPSDNPRLEIFESYLRPVLAPTQEWVDVERWRFHSRFIKWLRSEYLICKYELDIRKAISTHTQLRVTPLLQKNAFRETIRQGLVSRADTTKGEFAPLPNSSTLDKAFGMKSWIKTKTPQTEYIHMADITDRLGGHMQEIPGSNVQIPSIPVDASIQDLTFEEILEVSGCHVSSCNGFNALCEEGGIYEFWTEEYVSNLANYLMDRSNKYEGETMIVDVGSGDGILAHFLNKYINAYVGPGVKFGTKTNHKRRKIRGKSKVTVLATDDRSWNIEPKAEVEKINMIEAMQKYSPRDEMGKRRHQLIVICSWMPMGIDWTQSFRDHGADEYILIGECDDGNCGHNWITFGNPAFRDSFGDNENLRGIIAPYKLDGFERIDLEELSLLQYSRFDGRGSGSSKTISFRRS